ncbi:MAG: hypothetical protein AB1746_09270 [Candidatus Zixiibacteriota bacterium]
MIIKSFGAPTVAAALKKIREELGGDAVVLKTRVCPEMEAALTGQKFEVTACIDENSYSQYKSSKKSPKTTTTSAVETDRKKVVVTPQDDNKTADFAGLEKTFNRILSAHRSPDLFTTLPKDVRPVMLNLLDSDVPIEIAHRIAQRTSENHNAADNIDQTALAILHDEIRRITTATVSVERGMKIAFIGPSGVGKTSVMGKAAAQLCTKFGQKVKLLSLDQMKIAAYEEIGAYADLLELQAGFCRQLQAGIDEDSVCLIDTPSVGCAERRQEKLRGELESIAPDIIFFVFSACNRATDLIDSINMFEKFKPNYLVATHLDETDRWGGIPAMAEYLDIPTAFITDSPGGIGELHVPDAAAIARRLLKLEVSANVD